jgi:hypothetical protein
MLVGGGIYLAIVALFALVAPWNLFFGGHFQPMGGWQGWGRLHSTAAGGDYFMYIHLGVTIPFPAKAPISGVAYVCTPRGEKYRLMLHGEMPRDHGADLKGVPLYFYMTKDVPMLSINRDRRPRLELHGTFGDSQLIVEDRGSLATAFNSDATLSSPQQQRRSRVRENIKVTFQESTPWVLIPSCPAAK